jgi:PhnB protein
MPKAKKKAAGLKKKKPVKSKKVSVKKKTTKKTKAKKTTAKKTNAKKTKALKKKTSSRSKKVSAIPKGYNHITPYLIVSNGAGAIEFYKKVFGAKEVVRMERSGGKISHAELQIGDSRIMLSDAFPEMESHSPESFGGSPVGIHLYVKNVDEIVTRAVDAGAKLLKPITNMFYGDRSGSLTDPYGHQWSVATHIEDVTPAQMRKRAAELFENN